MCFGVFVIYSLKTLFFLIYFIKKFNRSSKHKEGNEEKRNETLPDPTSLGISQSENSYVKPSDSTPIWSFMLRSTDPEPEQVSTFLCDSISTYILLLIFYF